MTEKQPTPLRELHQMRPVPAVVGALSNLLERAKRGEIRALAYCADCQGHFTRVGIQGEEGGSNVADMVYLLRKLEFEIMLGTHDDAESELGLPEDPQ